jgi:Icc-related predicted phosphoesterase
MKLTILSDTHEQHEKVIVAPTDVLIHCGDFSHEGGYVAVCSFLKWFKAQPAKHKIYIAGNHDKSFESPYSRTKEEVLALFPDLIYLENSGVEIDGVKFWGSPWQPEFCNWAFNLPRNSQRLIDKWAECPLDTDVVISHGPPKTILDLNSQGTMCGCEVLLQRIAEVQPKVHCFGHIHHSHGVTGLGDTVFVNGSVLDDNYQMTYKPETIEVNK